MGIGIDPRQYPDNTSTKGITRTPFEEQMKGHIPIISESLYRNIEPVAYTGHKDQIVDAIKDVVKLKGEDLGTGLRDKGTLAYRRNQSYFSSRDREDGWRLFLGLPQIYNTFGPSNFKPSITKDNENKDYFKIKRITNQISSAMDHNDLGFWKDTKEFIEKVKSSPGGRLQFRDNLAAGPMGTFQFSHGKDEHGSYIAYYDKHDLEFPLANKIGKPFEIYDRIYYDPKTYKVIPEDKIWEMKLKKLIGMK